jgi:hypothetical protein
MNVKRTDLLSSHISSRRFFVRKQNIIDLRLIKTSNDNCCGKEEKKTRVPLNKIKTFSKIKKSIVSIPNESIINVQKQTRIPESVSFEKIPLCYEALDNAWPLSNERVKNLMITNKRCYFSNEAVSIKPITASPFI